MKLNYDCIRQILLFCEDNITLDDNNVLSTLGFKELKHLSFPPQDIFYSVKYMKEAELLDAHISIADGQIFSDFVIFDITVNGYQFLENIKNDTTWNKTKEISKKVGASSIEILSQIATGVLTNVISNQF